MGGRSIGSSVALGCVFTLPCRIERDGRWFIASCDPLDVHTQARTEAKARANLVEALELFLESCYERGVLDQVLTNAGIRTAGRRGAQVSGTDTVSVRLPLTLRIRGQPRPRTLAHA